jgi:acyl-CoA dehydrogenase
MIDTNYTQAERGLEYFLARLNDPAKKPFGQPLSSHGIQLERVARSRIEIDTARLSVLNAAITIDEMGAKGAMKEIAEVKVQVPSMMLEVLDRAMQAYGGAGVCQDTPLAAMWANGRTMRIVDGPDEVHVLQLGKNENKRGNALRERIDKQKARATEMLASYGLNEVDFLCLDRAYGQPKL